MEALTNLLRQFMMLDTNIVLFKTISDNPFLRDVVTDLNTNKQLRFGLTADGGVLPDYSDTSVNLYGKEPGPIQLKDTGAFYKSFEVILTDDGFWITADDEKTENGVTTRLFQKYGVYGEIAGLTNEGGGR